MMEKVKEVPLNSSNFLADIHLARGTIAFSSSKNQQCLGFNVKNCLLCNLRVLHCPK